MTFTPWTVYDLSTRRPKRAGLINSLLVPAYDEATEGLLLGAKADLKRDEVIVPADGSPPYLQPRAE